MSLGTVLVGFAEALAGPEVTWSLLDAGFEVVAFTRKGRTSALRHSRHIEVHEICPPEVDLQAAHLDLQLLLVSLAKDTGVKRILLPLDDTAVWLCSVLPPGSEWLLAGPRETSADLALNKQVQIQAALDAGFNVPQTHIALTASDVFSCCDEASFPIILRSAECVPRRQNRVFKSRNWICSNREEVKRAVDDWAELVPLLVQPFISGIGEGIFGLATREGVRAFSAHRRLRMMNPHGSGSSACVSQPVPKELTPKAEELLRKNHWTGLFMIELLRDHTGKVWFVELNGRPWGSMALSRRQGLEYPAWFVELLLNPQSQVGMAPPSSEGLVCRNIGREIVHLLFVLRGPKSQALTSWPSFWKTLGQVSRVQWGDAVYNWRREDPKVFVADFCYTIQSNVFKSRG